jgi:hypothetical protein
MRVSAAAATAAADTAAGTMPKVHAVKLVCTAIAASA